MSRIRFEPDRAGIRRLLKDGDVAAGLADAGRELKHRVEQAAPQRTGAFLRSLSVQRPEVEGNEASVAVSSSDPFAHLIEFGSVNNPPYAPFRRGVEAMGLRLEDD